MTVGFDLGAVSFFSTLCSALYIWSKCAPEADAVDSYKKLNSPGSDPLSKSKTILIVSTHVLVALNYTLGLLFALTIDETILKNFGMYCFVFMWGWFYSAYRLWNLLKEWNGRMQEEKVELNGLYDFERSGSSPSLYSMSGSMHSNADTASIGSKSQTYY